MSNSKPRPGLIILRKLYRAVLYLGFLCLSTLLLLEACYRWGIVDFYGGNLRLLNHRELTDLADRPSILVIGDSFTADQQSYVKHLRERTNTHRIINAAVPGTCIRQHQQFAGKRFREFEPELVIYQVYVGNDLLEYRHPTSGPGISWQRKCYWWLADRFLSLGYINSRLPALKNTLLPTQAVDQDAKAGQEFNPATYNARTKMLLRAEPELLENSIRLLQLRRSDAQAVIEDIEEMISNLPDDVPVVVMVLPHCAQTSPLYVERMQNLGAKIEDADALMNSSYPFYDLFHSSLTNNRTMVLNALPWLTGQGRKEWYYPSDPHLNPAGQERLADSLWVRVQHYIQD